MIYQEDISNLKTDIKEKIGQKIIVKGSLGRSRSFEKEATIEKAYQYKDVLTRTVEVDVFDGESYSPLVPPIIKAQRKMKASLE